jgi:hypothetical protein
MFMIFHGICNFKGVPSSVSIVPSFEDLELYRKDYQSCGRLAIQSWTCWLKSPSPNLVGDFFSPNLFLIFPMKAAMPGHLGVSGGVLGFDVFNFYARFCGSCFWMELDFNGVFLYIIM